jgi:hypothetical protein
MKTPSTVTARELSTLSIRELETATGGSAAPWTSSGSQIFNATQADQMKRDLDRAYGFGLKDPGRAVCRTIPGHPGQFTVQTPRLDGHGTRFTL